VDKGRPARNQDKGRNIQEIRGGRIGKEPGLNEQGPDMTGGDMKKENPAKNSKKVKRTGIEKKC